MKENKEFRSGSLKEFINQLLEERLSKEKMLKSEEPEKDIELFKLIEDENSQEKKCDGDCGCDGNCGDNCKCKLERLEDAPTLSEIVKSYECNEDKCKSKELDDIEDEIIRITEGLEPINSDTVLYCLVGNEEKILINKSNCNIVHIPILRRRLILNISVNVEEVIIEPDMNDVYDVILMLDDYMNERDLYTVGELYNSGLLIDFDDSIELIELSPLEYRGLTSSK